MDQFQEATKQLFSGWAPIYDSFVFRLYFDPMYRRLLQFFDQHAAPLLLPQTRVLDVACGTGEIIFRLAHKYPSVQFAGIDLTPAMVEQARKKTALLPRVEVIEGEASMLPFAEGAFTAVICSEAFHHFDRPDVALREMFRVLQHGGVLLLVDPGGRSSWLTKLLEVVSKTFEVNRQLYSQQELRLLLEGAGFSVVVASTRMLNNFFVCIKNMV